MDVAPHNIMIYNIVTTQAHLI